MIIIIIFSFALTETALSFSICKLKPWLSPVCVINESDWEVVYQTAATLQPPRAVARGHGTPENGGHNDLTSKKARRQSGFSV